MLRIESHNVEATMSLGQAVAGVVRSGDLIGLIGELGAGKTQFVRGMARGMHIETARVSSPTFVFLQEYDSVGEQSPVLVHVDAYRLSGTDDLASIGWEADGEELRSGAVVVVEWADRIGDAMGENWLEVQIFHNDDGRTITLKPHGDWHRRIDNLQTAIESACGSLPPLSRGLREC